jgi:hypothetical protein
MYNENNSGTPTIRFTLAQITLSIELTLLSKIELMASG